MTTAGSKKWIVAFCFLLLLHFICFSAALAQHLNAPLANTNRHPKISSYLQKLEKEYKKGANADQLVAQGMNTGSPAPDRVAVYLMSAPGNPIDETALSNMGAEITKRSNNVIRAKVPIERLTAVADTVSGISFMKMPDPLIPTVIESEGVNLTGANIYHNAGYDGTGVKVAVIDVGFQNLSDAINNNELPINVVRVDCTGTSCISSDFSSETDNHGTAVAEIVCDMAPGALLYLIKVADRLDLRDAKDYAVQNGIKIINLSGGYLNQNFYDGKCWSTNAVCTADDAYAHNILWVNAVGNEAQQHYEAVFTDSSDPQDGWHNVSGDNETIKIYAYAGDTIELLLTWDAWPTTDQDYDLYLFESSSDKLNPVASSTTIQTGTQPPIEDISYDVHTNGFFYVAIYKNTATSDHLLDLYSVNHNLTPSVAASSLLTPADSAHVLAVGAINYINLATGPQEPYSSQGPTNDSINITIKPDIMGPDYVSNSIEGVFAGTSASSPHVAGAAALILQKNPGITVDQLRNTLTSTAIAMTSSAPNDSVPNNIYGYGRLNLDINAAIPSSSTGTTGGSSTGTSDGGGGCFIATAAYVSYEAPYDLILRKMRDRFLATNAVGKAFVHLYHTYSPPIADIIANHHSLKIAVRIGLLPLVGISWLALKKGPLFTLFALVLITLLILGLIRLVSSRMFQRMDKVRKEHQWH
jgi:subtilisin family serine protease